MKNRNLQPTCGLCGSKLGPEAVRVCDGCVNAAAEPAKKEPPHCDPEGRRDVA